MTPDPSVPSWRRRLAAPFGVQAGEVPGVLAGLALFFLLFASYFMLRPVRETMGIAGGVDQLQWLWTATFVATLVTLPLFGWIAGRVRRRRILPWTYVFLAATVLGFALGFARSPESVWMARAFYVWLSVFNLLAVSVAWSVLADLFHAAQARRLFALMAAGASAGGLVGPLLGVLLVEALGHAGLLVLSALLMLAATFAAHALQRWRDHHPLAPGDSEARTRALGGNPFAGLTTVLRSPYLLGIAAFVLLLASVTTFLYFEQARLVAETFPDRVEQTRVFGIIDTVVQALAILSQLFVTGRVAQRLGVGVLLVGVPLVMAMAFLWLAFAPVFAVLAVVMVVRRAGEYAFVRPGREMLFTTVAPEAKYKAKNFIDTVVYRGADALSAWVRTGVDLIAQHPAAVALLGSLIALLWAGNGAWLARRHARSTPASPAAPATLAPADARV
jgi:AAA family ATP:ADP antiporter